MSNLSVRIAKVEKMIESVDAKTSNKAICFGNVQLRSKREAKDFVSNMKNPNLLLIRLMPRRSDVRRGLGP